MRHYWHLNICTIIIYRTLCLLQYEAPVELGDQASGRGGAEREPFIAGALLELSVRLCRGNFLMYHASLGMFGRKQSSCTGFQAGWHVATGEHDGLDDFVQQFVIMMACLTVLTMSV
jgi:hypothetical protein